MKREIEIKIQIDDQNTILIKQWLQDHARFVATKHQVDYYFDNPKASFSHILPDGTKGALDYLRVRTGEENLIAFKHYYVKKDGNPSHCDEYETKIEDGQAMMAIFKNLGYAETALIDKVRTIYQYQDFEIALDEVKQLGNFVEIEIIDSNTDPHKGQKMLQDFIHTIGIEEYQEQVRGYVAMYWNPQVNFGKIHKGSKK